jgi:hypothetical protein
MPVQTLDLSVASSYLIFEFEVVPLQLRCFARQAE